MKYPDAGYDDVTPPARSFSTSKKKDAKKVAPRSLQSQF